MDDIVVLILTLIFIVAGIFGQMRKRQLPPEQPGDAAHPGAGLWQSLEYDEDEDEPKGVDVKVHPANEGGRLDRLHTSSGIMQRGFVRSILPATPQIPVVKQVKKKLFPLKKAVIYSEILNRKYF